LAAQEENDRKRESYDASKVANEHGAGGLMQLNTRLPIDLRAGLIEAQSTFTRELGRKPSIQELVAACLRIGLADHEAVIAAMNDGES
jgi:hypothetical protein